jgi:hypothetical protein
VRNTQLHKGVAPLSEHAHPLVYQRHCAKLSSFQPVIVDSGVCSRGRPSAVGDTRRDRLRGISQGFLQDCVTISQEILEDFAKIPWGFRDSVGRASPLERFLAATAATAKLRLTLAPMSIAQPGNSRAFCRRKRMGAPSADVRLIN